MFVNRYHNYVNMFSVVNRTLYFDFDSKILHGNLTPLANRKQGFFFEIQIENIEKHYLLSNGKKLIEIPINKPIFTELCKQVGTGFVNTGFFTTGCK